MFPLVKGWKCREFACKDEKGHKLGAKRLDKSEPGGYARGSKPEMA
jgi:hypothetical protein